MRNSETYKRCGGLYYPIQFLENGNIVVLDEPTSEAELRDMMIKEKIAEYEREIKAFL